MFLNSEIVRGVDTIEFNVKTSHAKVINCYLFEIFNKDESKTQYVDKGKSYRNAYFSSGNIKNSDIAFIVPVRKNRITYAKYLSCSLKIENAGIEKLASILSIFRKCFAEKTAKGKSFISCLTIKTIDIAHDYLFEKHERAHLFLEYVASKLHICGTKRYINYKKVGNTHYFCSGGAVNKLFSLGSGFRCYPKTDPETGCFFARLELMLRSADTVRRFGIHVDDLADSKMSNSDLAASILDKAISLDIFRLKITNDRVKFLDQFIANEFERLCCASRCMEDIKIKSFIGYLEAAYPDDERKTGQRKLDIINKLKKLGLIPEKIFKRKESYFSFDDSFAGQLDSGEFFIPDSFVDVFCKEREIPAIGCCR